MESEPAFPVTREELVSYADGSGQGLMPVSYPGLTKREWFAGQAMAALIPTLQGSGSREEAGKLVADAALLFADALIAALEPKT